MRNAGLDEAQAGIKTSGRNTSNLRYEDDTTLMAESEEELKSLLMKVKEESENVLLCLSVLPLLCSIFFIFKIMFLVRLSYLIKANISVCPSWFLHL